MIFTPTTLSGSYEIVLQPITDNRGWFARSFCKEEFKQINHFKEWVQMNHSFTAEKGAIRGMHFQHPPYTEVKVVRCISGSVFDVLIDLRKGSSTFMQWYGAKLSAEKKNMLYIPEGFAHGFQTLETNCELIYLHSEFYKKGVEGGVKYNDPAIDINWPLPVTEISDRDNNHVFLDNNFKGI